MEAGRRRPSPQRPTGGEAAGVERSPRGGGQVRIWTGEGQADLCFVASPLAETVNSLAVLLYPKHHPLHHPWARATIRRVPGALRRRLKDLQFVLEVQIPGFLRPRLGVGTPRIEDELAWVRGRDQKAATTELLTALARTLIRLARPRGGPTAASPTLAELADPTAAELPGAARRLARLALADPAATFARLLEAVEEYWEATFSAQWEDEIGPRLSAEVSDAEEAVRAEGAWAILRSIFGPRSGDGGPGWIRLLGPHDHELSLDRRPLVLMPATFAPTRPEVLCDPPWGPTVVYPVPEAVESPPRLPPRDMVNGIRALSDGTRWLALQLIAERPRCTQELAPLLKMTEANVSKHLRSLVRSGVLEASREGYYVMYSLVVERIEQLLSWPLSFLFGPTGEE